MQPNVMMTGARNFNQAGEVGRLQPFVLLCGRKTAQEQANSTFVLQGMASILVNTYNVVKRTKIPEIISGQRLHLENKPHNFLGSCVRYSFWQKHLVKINCFFLAFLSCELLEDDNLVLAGAKIARTIKL